MIQNEPERVKENLQEPQRERVIVYIDGFNLYYGMRDSGFNRYLWLDLPEFSRNLLKASQVLVTTRYFTSRISGPPDKQKRQSIYLDALATMEGKVLSIAFGQYRQNHSECPRCKFGYDVPNEKMTDVNIAVAMLEDAYTDQFDTALLVSADSDLYGPVAAIRRLFPNKRVVLAFPPARRSAELLKVASASFVIGKKVLRYSQLPETVVGQGGYPLQRPAKWR